MENTFPVLFALLILIAVLAFILTKFDILHPFTIVSCLFTFSVFLCLTKAKDLSLSMSSDACIVVLSALLIFGGACIWIEYLFHDKGVNITYCEQWSLNGSLYCVFLVMAILCIIFQAKETHDLATGLNPHVSYDMILRTVRKAIERQEIRMSRWTSYRSVFVLSFAYVTLFLGMNNLFLAKAKSYLQYVKCVVPSIIYIVSIMLSGSRLNFLNLVGFILIVGGILYEKHHNFDNKSKLNLVIISIVTGTLFIFGFLALGMLTKKVSIGGMDPWLVIVHYGGLSMPAFSVFLDQVHLESNLIGQETLLGIYGNLRTLGFDIPRTSIFLNFTQFDGIGTNVYTIMRRYIVDYGYLGMYIWMWLIGMSYTLFYNYAKYFSKSRLYILLYGTFVSPLFLMSSDDLLLTTVVNTSTIYKVITITLMYKFLIKREVDSNI